MLPPITKQYKDLSTTQYFQFRFYCDCCGDYWDSEKYPFSLRDETPKSKERKTVYELIWQSEHYDAYERANNEAAFHFNLCRKCGKRVCQDCFEELDFYCKECAKGNQTEEGDDR